MAQKSKATSRTPKKSTTESTKVTRITATDTKPKAKSELTSSAKTSVKTEKKPVQKEKSKQDTTPVKSERKNIFAAIIGYFKGSWAELRQVRWPNRRTTWGLTLAVIIFTAFFIALIVLLDYVFQLLFDRILG